MDFSELVQERYSVRAYRPDPVPDDALAAVLEAACLAPTACNLQGFRLVVLHTTGRRKELERIYPRAWFADAPIVIAACGLPAESWTRRDDRKNFVDIDAAIVMDHLILAAADRGLGTCWIGAFDPDAARDVLALPPGVEPIVFTPLGYPADQPRAKKRKPLTDIVRYEHW
jgi:nitroreductase